MATGEGLAVVATALTMALIAIGFVFAMDWLEHHFRGMLAAPEGDELKAAAIVPELAASAPRYRGRCRCRACRRQASDLSHDYIGV